MVIAYLPGFRRCPTPPGMGGSVGDPEEARKAYERYQAFLEKANDRQSGSTMLLKPSGHYLLERDGRGGVIAPSCPSSGQTWVR
jgi:hypothetical protein